MRRAVSVSEHADRGLLAEVLARPLTDLRGVSARREALLAKLDVRNWIDLAYFFPRAYEDWSSLLPIQALTDGEDHVFSAHVVRVPSIQWRGRRSIVRTVLRDGTGSVSAVWFNQPWVAEKLEKGEAYLFRGRVTRQGRLFSLANPTFVSPDTAEEQAPLLPIYHLTAGLTQNHSAIPR